MKKWIIIYGAMIAANIAVALVCPGLVNISLASVFPIVFILSLLAAEFGQAIKQRIYGDAYMMRHFVKYTKSKDADGKSGGAFALDSDEAEKIMSPPDKPSLEEQKGFWSAVNIYILLQLPLVPFFSDTVKIGCTLAVFFVFAFVILIAQAVIMLDHAKKKKEAEARAIEEQRKREEQGMWK